MQSSVDDQIELSLQYEYEKSLTNPSLVVPNLSERDDLQLWLMDTFPKYKCSIHTRTLACLYIDTYLIKRPLTRKDLLKLLGIISLSIALKYEENVTITPSEISEFFSHRFSEDTVNTLEMHMLKTLDWKLTRSTPSFIIRLILKWIFQDNIFDAVMKKAEAFAVIGVINSHIAVKGEFLVSIAAVCLALDFFGIGSFLEEWWVEIKKYFNISRFDVDEIREKIIKIVSNKE